ncbi:ABC transporter substrate-binding protein [Actinoplanes sp. NPDC026619]|uniref:ABC transporter substrate-binding protein n=1 Tax=Actinoplanes sp. NPDC026619 TaxID=3155798 RepID=UPI00340521AD
MNRKIAPLLLAALLLTACGSPSSPKEESGTIRLGIVQGQDFTHALPARIAEAQDLFTKHGLKVQIVDFSAGSDLVKAIAGGTIDVGEATGLDVVAASANGVDLKAFYGTAATTPMAVIVKDRSPIRAITDLGGKKVGISKFGSLTDFTVKLIAKQTGAKGITPVPLGAPSANTAALGKGDVDAIILPVEFAYTLQAAGTPVTAIRIADLTTDSQFGTLAASGKYLSANRDLATKLTQAYAEAITYLQANKDSAVQLSVAKLAMKQEVAVQTFDELAKDFTANGKINVNGLKSYAESLPTLNLAKKVPAEADYYDPGFAAK